MGSLILRGQMHQERRIETRQAEKRTKTATQTKAKQRNPFDPHTSPRRKQSTNMSLLVCRSEFGARAA